MEKINAKNLFILYKDTLDRCGKFLYMEENEIIEFYLFEDFQTGIYSFLHEDNLKVLYLNDYISRIKMEKSLELRQKVINQLNDKNRTAEYVKTSDKWKEIILLCDEIKKL
jgi:uncharacterized protein YfaA (DUF2138 family)